MKFTQALRLADELELPDLRGQFVQLYLKDWGGEKPPCCAIGGAAVASGQVAIGFEDSPFGDTVLLALTDEAIHSAESPTFDDAVFSDLQWDLVFQCPEGDYPQGMSLKTIVIHLYDHHLWSRTQIADWLDGRAEYITLTKGAVSA